MYATASATRIKAARRLTKRALRERERSFLAEGPQAVSEALATGARISGLFVTAPAQARHADLVEAAADAGVEVQLVSGEVMGELAQTITPQGLLAVCDFVDVPLDRARTPPPCGWWPCSPTSGTPATRAPCCAPPTRRARTRSSSPTRRLTCTTANACARPRAACSTCRWWPAAGCRRRSPPCAAGLRVFAADGRAGVTLDDPATRGGAVGADRVAVRQRGLGPARRPAGARRRSVRGPDLRPRGVAEPRLGGGGVPVRLGLRAAGRGWLIRPDATRENTSRAIMITSRCSPLSLPANPRGIGYLRYNVAKSRSGVLSVRYVFALESDHIPSPASRNEPATAARCAPSGRRRRSRGGQPTGPAHTCPRRGRGDPICARRRGRRPGADGGRAARRPRGGRRHRPPGRLQPGRRPAHLHRRRRCDGSCGPSRT